MTVSSPPSTSTKHHLDEAPPPPSAKKLKTGTLDGFLIKPKSAPTPAKTSVEPAKDGADDPVGGETIRTSETISSASDTQLGAASPKEGAIAEITTTTHAATNTNATNTDQTQTEAPASVPPPKATASAEAFDPLVWLESLPTGATKPSTRELLALEATTMDPSWLALVKGELTKSYFLGLKRFLWTQGIEDQNSKLGKVYPPAKDIYAWSRYTPLTKVRVVIIGQDPYHGPGQAHGLCFSVRPGVAVPPSLRNIYKEIGLENPGFTPPKHGNLISWAQHGVLLLNTSLTVEAAKAGSHAKKGWETLTDKLIELVDKYGGSGEVGRKGEGVVFLAWGAWAGKRVERLDQKKHLVLKSAHPSPLSASRGFIGNNHFKQCNEWLEAKYGPESKVPWTEVDVNAA